jgi:hypothetical protein
MISPVECITRGAHTCVGPSRACGGLYTHAPCAESTAGLVLPENDEAARSVWPVEDWIEGFDNVAFVRELSVELVARAHGEPSCRGSWLA